MTSATAPLLAVAAAAKYAPQWILGSVGSDPLTLQVLGVPVAVLNGALTPAGNPSPNDLTDEYVKQFQEINTKYNKAAFDDYVLQGMNVGMMTVQALRAAGQNLTRKGLIRALETKAQPLLRLLTHLLDIHGLATLAIPATTWLLWVQPVTASHTVDQLFSTPPIAARVQ